MLKSPISDIVLDLGDSSHARFTQFGVIRPQKCLHQYFTCELGLASTHTQIARSPRVWWFLSAMSTLYSDIFQKCLASKPKVIRG